ncbi:MAG: hypothetical protein KGI78_01800 [Patescibacteria group bacterium]|nr:hypothetical protein [Patescibacteria group bacterium]MDE1944224.1 hypothetical protein [Patescibacteria group bacterium]MDE1945317.1 hypothetical protein [Patescibacteria group bacterium]MDE2057569.1 hypothetical protein [Patescibacteria group bacterium]
MNDSFEDVQGIGLPFIERIRRTRAIRLGSVVTFDYDGERQLHMLICHRLGRNGWVDAERHVRYSLDWLNQFAPERQYSIVDIGTGRVGKRDGANPAVIRRAMGNSHLPVTLFIFPELAKARVEMRMPVRPLVVWDRELGPAEIPFAEAA